MKKQIPVNNSSSVNTQAMRYSAMVSSQRYTVTNYRAPTITGNIIATVDPTFTGYATVEGNLNIVDNIAITNALRGPVTGYLNVARDAIIGGSVYSTNLYITGNVYFPNSAYGFTSNIFSPTLISVNQSTTSIAVLRSSSYQILLYGSSTYNQILYTANGISYTSSKTLPFSNNSTAGRCTNALWNGSAWVATGCGTSCSIAYSTDGTNWKNVEPMVLFSPGDSNYGGAYGVGWNGYIWVVGGTTDSIGVHASLAYSTDGIQWTKSQSNPFLGGYCSCVKWNGVIWVASGAGTSPASTLAYSYDGKTWISLDTRLNPIFPLGCLFVTWNGNQWLAGGNGSMMAYSADGIHWTTYIHPLLTTVRNAGWNDKTCMWITIGDGPNDFMSYSYDAINWTGLGKPIILNGYFVGWVAKLNLWIAGGNIGYATNAVIQSTDGINWTNINNNISLGIFFGFSTTDEYSGNLNSQGNAQYFGERVNIQNSLFVNGGSPITGPYTGSLVVNGGISTTDSVYMNKDGIIQGNLTVANQFHLQGTQDAVSTSTGAIQIAGGAGIGGSMFLGRNMTIYGTQDSISVTSGSLVVQGGAGIQGNVFLGRSSVESTSYSTGALVVNGGVGIGASANIRRNVFVGGSIQGTTLQITSTDYAADISGNVGIGGTVNIGKDINIGRNISIGGVLIISGGLSLNEASLVGNLTVGGNLYANSQCIVSNTTDSVSTYTGSVITAGGIGIAKSVTIGNKLTIQGTNDATSVSSGSLIVSGGIGIQGNVFTGNNLSVRNSVLILGTTDTTTPSTGSLILSGGVGIAKSIQIGNNATIGQNLSVSGTVSGASSASFTGNVLVGGNLSVSNGATVNGAVNIASGLNNLFIAGIPINNVLPNTLYATIDASFGANVIVKGTQNATTTGTGALLVYGGASVSNSMIIGNTMQVLSTENSTSSNSGACVITGGIGVAKDAYINGNLTTNQYLLLGKSTKNIYVGGSDNPFAYSADVCFNTVLGYNSGVSTGSYNTYLGSNATTDNKASYSNSTVIGYGAKATSSHQIVLGTSAETISIPGTVFGTDAISTGMGALVVNGGIGTTGNLQCGKNISIYGTTDATTLGTGALQVMGGSSISGSLIVANTITCTNVTDNAFTVTGGMKIGGNVSLTKNMSILSTIDSTNTSNGALTLFGGAGIKGSLNVGNTVQIGSTLNTYGPNTGALVVQGGVSIGQDINVQGNSVIGSNLYITGTTTSEGPVYIYSSDIYINANQVDADPHTFLILHAGGNRDPNYAIPVLNIGVDTVPSDLNITNRLYVTNGCELNGDVVINGVSFDPYNYTRPTSYNGLVNITNTVDSTSTSTGALVIAGGMGIATNMNIGRRITVPTTKTSAIGVPYNLSSNRMVTFTDGSFNIYDSLNWVDQADPSFSVTNVIPNLPETTLTSRVNANSGILNGGGMAYNGSMWIGVFNGIQNNNQFFNTGIYQSVDGVNWQVVALSVFSLTSGTIFTWNGVAWNNLMWIVCGNPNTYSPGNQYTSAILYSLDGTNWYNTSVSNFVGCSAAWNGSMWVSVGQTLLSLANIVYSYDGYNWTVATLTGPQASQTNILNSVACANGRVWVAAGSNSIYYSMDGINWQPITIGISLIGYNFTSVVWNGSIWLCIGTSPIVTTPLPATYTTILLSSYDGIHWTTISMTWSNLPGSFQSNLYQFYQIAWNAGANRWYLTSSYGLFYAVVSNPAAWYVLPNLNNVTLYPCISIACNNVGSISTQGSLSASSVLVSGADGVTIQSTSTSYSTSSGALVVAGGVGIGGTVNLVNPITLNYTSLPSVTLAQIGYVLKGTFTANMTIGNGSWVNISNVSLPIGVWYLNGQAVIGMSSGSITVSDAALGIQSSYTSNIPYAFSQMYFGTNNALTGSSASTAYYSANISQVFTNSSTGNVTLYLSCLMSYTGSGSDPIVESANCFFTATRII